MKKTLTIIISLILLLTGTIITILLLQKRSSVPSISSNILSLTQPVTTFSGTVVSISGNTLTLTQTVIEQLPVSIYDPNLPLDEAPTDPLPSPVTHTLTYQVLVTDQTIISQPTAMVVYLFKSLDPSSQTSQPTLSIQDIKEGQILSVTTNFDLRTISGDQFEATSIMLPSTSINILNGTIANISDNSLTLETLSPLSPLSPGDPAPVDIEKRELTLTITPNTEISGYNSQGQPQKYPLSSLHQNQTINVYVSENITENQSLSALRIEPLIVPDPIAPQSTPSLEPLP